MDRPRRAVRGQVRAAKHRWRTSLQLRTVVITALLTLVSAAVLALFLTQQITAGLFNARFDQVESEAVRGLTQVRSVFENADTTDEDSTASLVTRTLGSLAGDTGATITRTGTPAPDSAAIIFSRVCGAGARGSNARDSAVSRVVTLIPTAA